MKTILSLCLIAILAFSVTGCTTQNSKGKCIGINEEGKQVGVEYKYDGWNIAMAIIFCETIVVPIVVVLDQCKCPVE